MNHRKNLYGSNLKDRGTQSTGTIYPNKQTGTRCRYHYQIQMSTRPVDLHKEGIIVHKDSSLLDNPLIIDSQGPLITDNSQRVSNSNRLIYLILITIITDQL
jgi:hypothetical protein